MFDFVLENGKVVDADRVYKADVYIKDGKIAAISEEKGKFETKHTVDITGKLLFPGGIDTHMHIGEYKADFEEMDTSTAAAAVGGMTCLLDMPLNLKTPSVLNEDIFQEKKQHLLEKSYTDFCMYGAFVPANIDHLLAMHRLGAVAFKSFLSGAGSDFKAPNMAQVRDVLYQVKAFDGIVAFHCEDYWIIRQEMEKMIVQKKNTRKAFLDSRPLSAEMVAVRDIIELAEETGAKVHICHVSHPKVAQIIEEAQKRGVKVTGETCVHYLAFTQDDLIQKGCLYKCAPPLREPEAVEGLWHYLENGVLCSVASDHSPGMPGERDDTDKPIYEVGNGISGVQTMFQTYFDLVVKRGLPLSMITRTLAKQPAMRFGVYGKKGDIKVGFDADLVVVDPKLEWEVKEEELYYKQKISAFVGRKGVGKPIATYLRGRLVAKEGKIVGMNEGKFIYPFQEK